MPLTKFILATVALWLIAPMGQVTAQTVAPLPVSADITLENLKFVHQLTLEVVQYLVIGGITLLLGFLTQRALERYKARAVFLSSYTKKHIEAISEAWRLIYLWESTVRDYIRFYRTAVDPEDQHDLVDDLLPAMDESWRRSRDVRSYVDERRFWLGEELYARFVTYHNSLDPYLDAVVRGRYGTRIALEAAMYSSKQSLLSLLRVTPEKLYNT